MLLSHSCLRDMPPILQESSDFAYASQIKANPRTRSPYETFLIRFKVCVGSTTQESIF